VSTTTVEMLDVSDVTATVEMLDVSEIGRAHV
jgi:hypothetical protein